jgi:hypothetical protein
VVCGCSDEFSDRPDEGPKLGFRVLQGGWFMAGITYRPEIDGLRAVAVVPDVSSYEQGETVSQQFNDSIKGRPCRVCAGSRDPMAELASSSSARLHHGEEQ